MSKNFENILVPYNGTAGSEKAFKKAISLAHSINAKITIITCLEERNTFGFFKTKTSKQEFESTAKVSAVGIGLMGLIGFIIAMAMRMFK